MIEDQQPCARCSVPVGADWDELCPACERTESAELLLATALRKLTENRAAEAIRIIEDALETLRP